MVPRKRCFRFPKISVPKTIFQEGLDSMAARPYFDEELSRLKQGMIEMGELVKEAIDGSFEAVRSTIKPRRTWFPKTTCSLTKKNVKSKACCISLLLREQPVDQTDLGRNDRGIKNDYRPRAHRRSSRRNL